MKIYRHRAITLANELARIALSEVDAMSLQAAMINYDVLRKVKEDYSALEKELFKRIYGDVEKMNEEEKKTLQARRKYWKNSFVFVPENCGQWDFR